MKRMLKIFDTKKKKHLMGVNVLQGGGRGREKAAAIANNSVECCYPSKTAVHHTN